MELQTTLSATLKKNPNCCYIAIFKCNLPKEPWKQNKIVVMLQASSVIYQRKHKLLYTKPKKNTIVTHPTKENAKFFFLNTKKKNNEILWDQNHQNIHEVDDQDEDNDGLVLLISPKAKEKRGIQQWQWWMSLREGKKPRFEVWNWGGV